MAYDDKLDEWKLDPEMARPHDPYNPEFDFYYKKPEPYRRPVQEIIASWVVASLAAFGIGLIAGAFFVLVLRWLS
jgi:hypothetical protein